MRKVKREWDCPIDNFLVDLGEPLLSTFHEMGGTPNLLTTFGNLLRGSSMIFIYLGDLKMFSICYIWGYQFDCLDGFFARRYNMCSKFGDFYDHFSDTVFGVLMFNYIYWYKTWFHIFIYLFMLGMMTVHIGCIQIYYNGSKYKEYLDIFKLPFYKVGWLSWLKWFGCGSFILTSCLLVWI